MVFLIKWIFFYSDCFMFSKIRSRCIKIKFSPLQIEIPLSLGVMMVVVVCVCWGEGGGGGLCTLQPPQSCLFVWTVLEIIIISILLCSPIFKSFVLTLECLSKAWRLLISFPFLQVWHEKDPFLFKCPPGDMPKICSPSP